MFPALRKTLTQNLLLTVGIMVTLIVYSRFLFFDHISWDDPEMVFRNKAVRTFDLRALVSDHFVGNYIPVTMIVHAIGWFLFKTHNGGHHAINILLHIVNGILVFELGKRLLKNADVAGLTAVLFLLHPVQIESVGWISELKTVLSASFVLAASLKYMNHLERGKTGDWITCMVLFLLACLSKSSAVVFPILLLAFDLLFKSKLETKDVLSKSPFFILSLLFGIVNLQTQSADLFINYSHAFPYHERLGFAGYALMKYSILFFFPVKLSVIYPYPQNSWPALLTGYLFLTLIVVIVFLCVRGKKSQTLFFLLFTLIHLVLVLQFVPFGEVLYADRYMYLPVIGFSWLFSSLLVKFAPGVRVVSGAIILLLAVLSVSRSRVWKSAIHLYEDILSSFPNSFVALNSVGVEYMLHNEDNKALYYLNQSIQVSPSNYKGYYNRGLLYLKKQKPELAVKSFDESIRIYEYPKAYVGRGSAYHTMGDTKKAMEDAGRALSLDPNNVKAHLILGNCYSDRNELDKAIEEFDKCVEKEAFESDYYFRRAIVLGKMQNFLACLKDLNTCLQLDPSHTEGLYWRGVVKFNLKQDPCEDFKAAARKSYEPAVNAYHKYCQ